MMKKSLVGVVLFILATTYLSAESNKSAIKEKAVKSAATEAKKGEVKKEAPKKTNTKEEAIKEAMKLLEEMNLESVYQNAVKNSTKRITRTNPKYKKVEDKIRNFYEKYIGWKVMKKDLAKLYAKYFTPQELRDITNFYKTKTGKKVLSTMGKLAYEGQMLTRKKLMPHMDELQKILDSALKKEKKKVATKASAK